ncbi:CHASE3 domain-containing protein [Leptolyngbya sp. GB1-A1]|uniref:PAS domain S-box protein n=1 Tax=Leptolyngbya sp. GB1-A1 TaxID=2933908 RepID=UPI0032972C83
MNHTRQHFAQTQLQQRLTKAFVLPIVLLLLVSGIFIGQTLHLMTALQWVDHTDRVISHANRVQKLLLDMETGNRGYLLTREPIFLEPYEQARSQIGTATNQLKRLVSDNPRQVQQAEDLQQQQIQWTRGVPQVLALVDSDRVTLRATLLRRKGEMDRMRSLITNFIAIEEQLRAKRVQTVSQRTGFVITSSIGLAIASGAILAYLSGQQLRKVARTYTQLVNSLQQSLDDRDLAEEALRDSEERFRRAILEAPLPIMLHSETGEVLQINHQWEQITGYQLSDIPTIADWTERAYGDRRQTVQAEIDRLYDFQKSLAEGEFVVMTRAGEERIWEFFSSPVGRLADGRRLVISTAIDVTERKRIERQVQENYILLQSVINGTTDAIFMKDCQGRYQLVNQRVAQIMGQSVEGMLGKDDAEFLPPDLLSQIQAIDRTVMTTGRSQIFEEQIPENGEIRTYLSTKDPYIDAQGNITGIIGISRDITDRKLAEAQQQKSAQRLAALQAIDRAILRLDAPARIAEAALSRLVQVVPADQAAVLVFDLAQSQLQVLAGEIDTNPAGTVRPILDFTTPEVLVNREAIGYIKNLATLIQTQQSPLLQRLLAKGYHSFLAVALRADGHFLGDVVLIHREVDAFSAGDLEIVGEVANQLAIAIQQSQLRDQLQHYAADLEQRVAERTAKLKATNQELEAFTYSVSHDLRAPLRTMQGFAQALIEDYGDLLDDTAKSYIESIVEDAVQMSGLITDLLAYSRLSRSQINLQEVNLKEAINDAIKQLAVEIQEKQAEIILPEELPSVAAHRSTLVQVMANLFSNAMKFVEPGTVPQIHTYFREEQHEHQRWVKLFIEDNGIGIAPEHQERIFHVFERLHGAESYPGTGIGLAIVRKGLERMDGKVGVESALGQGSRFWIALPKAVLPDRGTHDPTHSTATH